MQKTNPELQLANDFARYTGANIFLTGKAGTGKTTFLHNLKKNSGKRMIVTAPTGVAAINAGGVTLHSFFQLPFGPFVPGSEEYARSSQRQYRFSNDKKRIIKTLDLLVIDEISMVRADLLDAVDASLRRHRRNNLPFGGVQLLMIGDLHQLSPVVKRDEWQILQDYYESVYFFSSQALAKTKLETIELKHIYRQSDPGFINILNQVRNDRLDATAKAKINQCHRANFIPNDEEGFITLTTHNASAATINQSRLQDLAGKDHFFAADITGEFPEHTYPTLANLRLKKNAQVMFVRNDQSPEKRYYNGKIGRITNISKNGIEVICAGDKENIIVKPLIWENIKYTINEATKEIEEDVIGKFEQYPLKLAWAITIHKSQGLTFEKAIIDAEAAFTPGQVYVALSRCKSMDGLVLSSPLTNRGMETDPAVQQFDLESLQNQPTTDQLLKAKICYQQHILNTCFDFTALRSMTNLLARLLTGNTQMIKISGPDISQIQQQAEADIFTVSENFKRQLNLIFAEGDLPENDPKIQERASKAAIWFSEKFHLIFAPLSQELQIQTDNQQLGKKINRAINNLNNEITVKLAGIKSCADKFSTSRYLRAITAASLDSSATKSHKRRHDYGESDLSYPEMFKILQEWRLKKAVELEIHQFQIIHIRVLIQIAVYLPEDIANLKVISGVGRKTVEKYGEEIVAQVANFRRQNNITEVAPPPEPVKRQYNKNPATNIPASSTKTISFNMFQKGLSIEQIAEERDLKYSTIEAHLIFSVESGEIDINRLLPPEKQEIIKKELAAEENVNSLSGVKERLGENYSYGEIRMMVALARHQENMAKEGKSEQ